MMKALKQRLTGLCGRRDRCRLPSCKSCFSTCTKAIIILINLAFLAAGWSLVALGLWMHVYQDAFFYTYLFRTNREIHNKDLSPGLAYENVPFVLIGIGGFVSAMSFLGCCGACAESVCFLSFHTLLTVILVGSEIIIASQTSSFLDQTNKQMLSSMFNQVHFRYNETAKMLHNGSLRTEPALLTLAWDILQIRLNCCGASGPQDYHFSSWFNHTQDRDGVFVPSSCCLLLNDDPYRPLVTDENICQAEAIKFILIEKTKDPKSQMKTTGCHAALVHWIVGYERIVVSILCVMVLVQVANLLLACFLMTWVKKKHSDYSWCENDEYE